jgi:biotin transport system substrate-specific component
MLPQLQGTTMTNNTARPIVYSAVDLDSSARLAKMALLGVLGSAAIAIAAHIKVPFYPVAMTMQTLVIFTLAAAYGRNLAVATLLLYIVEGAMGAPVFTGGAGLAYLMSGPTTGYLVGFVIAAAIVGEVADRGFSTKPFALFAAMLVGEVVILALGAAWLAYAFGFEKALAWGVGPFIVTDLIKIALASAIVPAVWALLRGK